MTLRTEIIEKIRKNKKLKLDLAYALDRSPSTIQRYLDNNDIMLTTEIALIKISNSLKVPKNNLLTETETL